MIAKTPKPPYYAVIFTSIKSTKIDGYEEMANKMLDLVKKQTGFLGYESASDKIGITISYWSDLDSIKNWKQNIDHKEAQIKGKSSWYSNYKTRIVKVEKDYEF